MLPLLVAPTGPIRSRVVDDGFFDEAAAAGPRAGPLKAGAGAGLRDVPPREAVAGKWRDRDDKDGFPERRREPDRVSAEVRLACVR